MGLRSRILKLVRPENGGPRCKAVLEGQPRTPREVEAFERIFRSMLAAGELVMVGKKRGARYGLPAARSRKAPRRRRARRARRIWSAKSIERLKRDYPNVATWKIARALKRPVYSVYGKAFALQLRKSAEYLAGPDACRLRRGDNIGAAYRFQPGQIPPNKGLRRPGWHVGRMRETQFKKGERSGKAAQHYMPIGATRLVDGYVYVKVAEVPNVPYTVNWKPLHVLEWERTNGRPVPDGHCLRFRDGNRLNTALGNLELITRQDNARRNAMHRLPEPIRRAIHAKAALNRRINRLEGKRAENA